MGASSSKVEEDKALQLCRDRKKYVRQALDGRCALAATHVAYIQSLNVTGTALRRFVEPEGPAESSLFTSTRATPEVAGFTDKSHSQFSLSPSSLSQRVDASENLSPAPSTPLSSLYVENHMKTSGSFSRKVVEKPSVAVLGSVTSSSTPKTTPHSAGRPEGSPFDNPPIAPDAPPWDYFGLFHPIDNHFSSEEVRELNQGREGADEVRHTKENNRDSAHEGEGMKDSSPGREELQESEDEFDDPSVDKLVRSFDNVNRAVDHTVVNDLPSTPLADSVASEIGIQNGDKYNSPALSPLRAASGVVFPIDVKTTPVKENGIGDKVASKGFFSTMKDIEYLFHKASESGTEVPRMLEANKFHFRPIFPGKESGSLASTMIKNCFSCGDDPSQVVEEPAAQTTTKYLTWHRTTSSHSSSSRNPLGAQATDDIGDLTSNIYDNFCMVSGSHASTLDRLHAWERKLYDEVKASGIVRKDYDQKRKLLRLLESKGQSNDNIDKTRAVVKDLHSRIRVAIERIDSISKKIEELRDKELQPQLEELIEGLKKMWEVMCECHKLQFNLISETNNNFNNYISLQSDSRRQIIICLENELGTLSSSFTKWTEAQKTYVQAINGWLYKCVSLSEKSSRRKRRIPAPPLRNYGPTIYVTCGVWLEELDKLPSKEVTDSIKALKAEVSHLLPRQEKHQGKGTNYTNSTPWQGGNHSESGFNLSRDEASENWITSLGRFRSRLVDFFGQLNRFADSSLTMFVKLQESIEESKRSIAQMNSQSQRTK